MPVYLVTDTSSDIKTMVEADRPAGAIAALVSNRFDVSKALDAGEALRLSQDGVSFVKAEGDSGTPGPQDEKQVNGITVSSSSPDCNVEAAATATRPAIEPLPDDAPEFAEVDEAPRARRSSLDEIFADAEDGNELDNLR